jgi:hypothetical protein
MGNGNIKRTRGGMMTLTKISSGSYQCGDWRVLRLVELWIVWNVNTQTRTARECRNTLRFGSFAEAKKFLAEVE